MVTVESCLLTVRDFVVVWATQVLYYNHVYPQEAFEKLTYLEVVVYRCRVPQLTSYLVEFANDAIKVLVEKKGGGHVHELLLLLYDEQTLHVKKRYLVDFSQFVGLGAQVSLLEFLTGGTVHLAKISIPNFDESTLYTHLRSLAFFHLEELKRTEEDLGLFFKLLINVDSDVNLQQQWVRLTSDDDKRPHKLVSLGEISVGFVCFSLHNEYVK